MSELKSLTLNGTTYDSFTDKTSSRSRLLSSDSNINDLLESGRYYITGTGNNTIIREIVTNAGIEIPVEASGMFAWALFVDVTKQERKSGGAGDHVGQPSQHVTLYFTDGRAGSRAAFEYDRVHNLSGVLADGEHWGDWYTANNIVTDNFVAEYGVSTYADIYNAFTAGKSVYCKNGYYVLPMTFYQNQSNTARFSGTAGGEEVVWQVRTNEWSSEALVDEDKFVAEYGVSTYQEIYSAMQEGKSVYVKSGAYEFPLVKISAPSWTAYFGGMADGQNVTLKVQVETWSSYNAVFDLTVQSGRLYLTVNGAVTGSGVDVSALTG